MTEQDQADYTFLLDNARVGQALQLPSFIHLDQPIGLWNYIRIANDITRQSSGHILDWGCGYGQMTYLLRQRGFQVTSFDIGAPGTALPDIPICHDLTVVRTQHPTNLPFELASFDAVLSCGVLEHVDEYSSQPGNELKSLREIARVLRPGGMFLIYQLPQKYAWQEAVIRRFKLGYSHPRRYTASEITHRLIDAGYRIRRVRRANLIPKNLTGMPGGVRRIYNRFSRPFITLDGWLSRVPLLNQVAGVLEIAAQRIE
jgi:SAM-dependent methyltransferase